MILILLAGIVCSNCHDRTIIVNWKPFGESERGSLFYYDPTRLNHPVEDVVGVWVMEVPSDSENIYTIITAMMEATGMVVPEDIKKCEQYTYSVILFEVNCAEHTIIPVCSEDFDKDGNLLYAGADEKETVREGMELGGFDARISSETVWSALYEAVCRKR